MDRCAGGDSARTLPDGGGHVSVEDQFRWLARLYPADWRERNEEDMISTLIDSTRPGRRLIRLADAADLARGALVVRARRIRETTIVDAVLALLLLALMGMLLWVWRENLSPDFVLTSFVVVLIPGTGVVFTVSTALARGRRQGMVAAVGCTLGIVPHLVATMIGLSGLMQVGATVFEAVRWAGVAYLTWMGISMIRDHGGLSIDRDTWSDTHRSSWSVVRQAVLLNLLNPKLTAFIFAFLPQFVGTTSGGFDVKMLGLSGMFMAMTLAVFGVYAYASGVARERLLRAPRALKWLHRSFGAVLIGFAARLAFTDR